MTRDEYQTWVRRHCGLHAGAAKGWTDTPEEARADLADVWFQAVESMSLDQAITASKVMVIAEDRPRFFADHPQWLTRKAAEYRAAAAERPARRFAGGEETFSCGYCMDEGRVFCAHPEYIRDLRSNVPAHPLTIVVACCCAAGDLFARPPRKQRDQTPRPRYAPHLWCRLTDRMNVEADVRQWLVERVTDNPNYCPELAGEF